MNEVYHAQPASTWSMKCYYDRVSCVFSASSVHTAEHTEDTRGGVAVPMYMYTKRAQFASINSCRFGAGEFFPFRPESRACTRCSHDHPYALLPAKRIGIVFCLLIRVVGNPEGEIGCSAWQGSIC